MKDLFKSVLTATSPTSALDNANIAASLETTKVSVIALAGTTELGSLPFVPSKGISPCDVPVFNAAAVPSVG